MNRTRSPTSSYRSQKEKKQCVQSAILNMKKFTQGLKKNASFFEASKKQKVKIPGNDDFYSAKSISAKNQLDQWNQNELGSPLTPSIQPTNYHKRQIKTSSMLTGNLPLRSTHTIKHDSVDKKSHRTKPQQNFKTEQVILSSSINGSSLNERRRNMIKSPHETSENKKKFFQEKPILTLKPIQDENINYNNDNGKLIEVLYKENSYLKQQLCTYKQLLLLISTKYKELEGKISEKVATDHLVDVLKAKLQDMQEQNSILKKSIQSQNIYLRNLGGKVGQEFQKIINHFKPYQNSMQALLITNKYLYNKIRDYEKMLIKLKCSQIIKKQQRIENTQCFPLQQCKFSFTEQQFQFKYGKITDQKVNQPLS